jgi:hypothetical protein
MPAAQHICLPFLPDQRFMAWRLGMFLPFALLLAVLVRWRRSLLPYLMVVHFLMDLATALMVLCVSPWPAANLQDPSAWAPLAAPCLYVGARAALLTYVPSRRAKPSARCRTAEWHSDILLWDRHAPNGSFGLTSAIC